MPTYTFFHHGTGSHRNRADDEIVKVLHDNVGGIELVDYLITDGPQGSASSQFANLRLGGDEAKAWIASRSADTQARDAHLKDRYGSYAGKHSVVDDFEGAQQTKPDRRNFGNTRRHIGSSPIKGDDLPWWQTPTETIANFTTADADGGVRTHKTNVPGVASVGVKNRFVKAGLTGEGWDDNIRRSIYALLRTWEPDANVIARSTSPEARPGAHPLPFTPPDVTANKLHFVFNFMHAFLQMHGLPPGVQRVRFRPDFRWRFRDPCTINMVGWSRGAVTCFRLANWISKVIDTSNVRIHIFAVDPVPGFDAVDTLPDAVTLPPTVRRAAIVLAQHEMRTGMRPVDADRLRISDPASTSVMFIPFPGEHSTVVRQKGGSLNNTPDLVKRLAWTFLSAHGTTWRDGFGFDYMSNPFLCSLYAETRLANADFVRHGETATQGQRRRGVAGGTYQRRLTNYGSSEAFVNDDHRKLFRSTYPILQQAFFNSPATLKARYEVNEPVGAELLRLKQNARPVLDWLGALFRISLVSPQQTLTFGNYEFIVPRPRPPATPPGSAKPLPAIPHWTIGRAGAQLDPPDSTHVRGNRPQEVAAECGIV